MAGIFKWLVRILAILLLALLVAAGIAAFIPIPQDQILSPDQYGAGAVGILPATSGLERQFPASNAPADNPITDAKVELGRLLFFDPILSDNDQIACASCHHPDYGFADNRPFSEGMEGELSRNTPTIWNADVATTLFWDGREDSLEGQALTAITHPSEMGSDPDQLVADLQAIPEYGVLFSEAFGTSDITIEQTQQAIAAFERTLLSKNSPYDQYIAGNKAALTPSQRRGLELFRSAATRCFECHAAPTFDTETFRVIGVPDDDPGRAGFAADAPAGAFAVPTLRNVALTAPYMHNGSFNALEEVVDFYAAGGGRSIDSQQIEDVDMFVLGFELSAQEKSDLINFLIALTDESGMPAIPDAVPSGLSIIQPAANPGRDLAASVNAVTSAGEFIQPRRSQPMALRVEPNGDIQAVVDQAQPGDTVVVPYGEYHQTVVIDLNDFSFIGEPNAAGDYPILHGDGERADGVIAAGNNFEMANFEVRHYRSNGILVEGSQNVHLHHLFVEDTGTYGVYPTRCTEVLVEYVTAVGMHDAGIYAGKSAQVVIRESEAYENVLGIEVENTVTADVYNNYVHDNATGILIDLLPNLPSKVSLKTKVHDNIVENNNHPNFAPPEITAAIAPSGAGIAILAADEVEVYDNVIRNNKTGGVGIFNLFLAYEADEIDVGPTPENNWVHDNVMENNGYDPAGLIKEMGIPGADILWDGSGAGNSFDQPGAALFPPVMPSSGWATPFRRIHYHTLNLLMKLL